MDQFHPVHNIEPKTSVTGPRGPGSGSQKRKQLPSPTVYGQKCGQVCRKALNQTEGRNWATGQPKLGNAQRLRGIVCIDPTTWSFEDTMIKLTQKRWTVRHSAPYSPLCSLHLLLVLVFRFVTVYTRLEHLSLTHRRPWLKT